MGRTRTHQQSATSFRCSACSQQFGRQEHLTRHMRIHTHEKPYQCPQCDKRFARPDVLSRHITSHEDQNETLPTTLSFRACKQCAVDRVRCSRGQPCKRCNERGVTCWYPPNRRAAPRQSPRNRQTVVQLQETTEPSEASASANLNPVTSSIQAPALYTFDTVPVQSDIPCDMSIPIAGIAVETVPSYDISSIPVPGQIGFGAFDVNWMSPQYPTDIDWESLLTGFAADDQWLRTQDGNFNQGEQLEQNAAGLTLINRQSAVMPSSHATLPTDLDHGSIPSGHAQISPSSLNSTEGRYYVNSEGARAPFGGRSYQRGSLTAVQGLCSPDSDAITSPLSPHSTLRIGLLPQAAYDKLTQQLLAENQAQALPVDLTRMPSPAQMNIYVRTYFDRFNPIFPILRKSAFPNITSDNWLLLLAVATVGARYGRRLHGKEPGEILWCLLDAILQRQQFSTWSHLIDGDSDSLFLPGQESRASILSSVSAMQVSILHIMLLLHSGKRSLVERALFERHSLVESCRTMSLLAWTPHSMNAGQLVGPAGHTAMKEWLNRESRIRVGMMVWFLDSMFLYEFDAKPMLDLEDVKTLIPSHDDVWEDPCLVAQGKMNFADMTLSDALETIYMEKKLPSHLGEFSSLLLVNAVYRNTRKILSREHSQLDSWTPSATAQHRETRDSLSAQSSWLPATPTASKWRNSACDCLDVLHWPANSKIAQHLGVEHHTILHLHLARLIILTPTVHIQSLAAHTSSGNSGCMNNDQRASYSSVRQQVLQWVIRDRYKARLSIIHCGALYWHVRRYSYDSILEPFAIYIATLILWAFCLSMQLPEVVEAVDQDGEEVPEPSFLHLDRPLDDELVQTFVRAGHKVAAFISKVGNIRDTSAPRKVLEEGIVLLSGEARISAPSGNEPPVERKACEDSFTWGIEESYIKVLRNLLDASPEDATITGS
ncbi:hypothetical protein FB567DRAFT_306949 [Paraphoma chrysanthemicola]|uniref:Uncharacterized protein n=1 Tax=Paraphoma chrysanthemicola TaxID=798071 RepID=A0A8K0RBV7_9PLEO|nr:hypothetical protein FB567DRAFT_306949 [Paraphoma chrysanthemicola]